jgi:hypothetical protein
MLVSHPCKKCLVRSICRKKCKKLLAYLSILDNDLLIDRIGIGCRNWIIYISISSDSMVDNFNTSCIHNTWYYYLRRK